MSVMDEGGQIYVYIYIYIYPMNDYNPILKHRPTHNPLHHPPPAGPTSPSWSSGRRPLRPLRPGEATFEVPSEAPRPVPASPGSPG
jgi:hypothetical protein